MILMGLLQLEIFQDIFQGPFPVATLYKAGEKKTLQDSTSNMLSKD